MPTSKSTPMRGQKPQKCRSDGKATQTLKRKSSSLSDLDQTTTKRRRMDDGPIRMQKNVVKVFASHCKPNYAQPWCCDSPTSSTSTAFPVRLQNGKKVLVTNAHCVEYATLVQVKRHACEAKAVAKVLCFGHECDLSILEVDDEAFWKGLTPFRIAAHLPKLQDAVWVMGYPMGGESLSVTQGVVSRVDLVEYAQSGRDLLGIQIDAAINSGNSGGPAVDEQGRVVGISFEALGQEEDAENIGYIIPVVVLQHFIQDYMKNGKFTGFGSAAFAYQALESASLRESLGLKQNETGVRVKSVDPAGNSHGVLQVNDVILEVDGKRVGNDATVVFERGRIPFEYVFQQGFVGDTCSLKVRRAEAQHPMMLNLSLQRKCSLVDNGLHVDLTSSPRSDAKKQSNPTGSVPVGPVPRYLIVGGLVFVPLNTPFLESAFGEDYASKRPEELTADLLSLVEDGVKEEASHEAVVLTKVLADPVNVGYTEMEYERLRTINGVKVRNLSHLNDLVEQSCDKYLRFEFESKEMIVLERRKAEQSLARMLTQNMIPSARSAVL